MSGIDKRNENPTYRKYVPFLDSSYNLYLLLYLTHTALFKARYYEIKEFGITSMELALLVIVDGLGKSATPAEISRWIMRKRPTVSELLNRMERNGLIIRTGCKDNKKHKKVTITNKGREALDQATKKDIWHTIMGSLSDDEYHQLWALLEKLKETAVSLTEATDMETKSRKG